LIGNSLGKVIPATLTLTISSKPRVVATSAELKSNELQNPIDVVSEIVKIATGCDQNFTIGIELDGDTPLSADTIEENQHKLYA